MQIYYENQNGKIIHGDNTEVLKTFEENTVDSCISDFPYDISFMNRDWDNTGNFYEWCKARAVELFRVIKPGGYVAVFGHPKTNHRLKCGFEDVGFEIVEEIDWIHCTGFPKSQDIGKMFDKAVNTEMSHRYEGFKTSGLKSLHEPITIFQKPLDGTYIQNIEKWGCGAMNIDACRVPFQNETDFDAVKEKCNFTENSKSIGFSSTSPIYGDGNITPEQARECVKPGGRFPPNIILDENTAELLDEQTGESVSIGGSGLASKQAIVENGERVFNGHMCQATGGYGDSGGGSRIFPIFKYCPKASPSERQLPNGKRNPHITLKPVELIKWLIKLLTPKEGLTIDVTAGSCTHGVAAEQLNRNEGYRLKWFDIEITNTESEPYCEVGKQRIADAARQRKLFDLQSL